MIAGAQGAPSLDPAGDDLWQLLPGTPVLAPDHLAVRVSAGPDAGSAAGLGGLSARQMAQVLRRAIDASGAHVAVVDALDARLSGEAGDRFAEALRILSRQKASYSTILSRRVHLLVPSPGAVLGDAPEWAGARLALRRAGGVWLETADPAAPWSAEDWLTWPREVVLTGGVDEFRVHVMIGAGDQEAIWRLARTGAANCLVLRNGPGASALGTSAAAFVAQYRATFPLSPAQPAAPCLPSPAIDPRVLSALAAAYAAETGGVAISPLVMPPVVAGDAAQVSLRLGVDPLGLAASLGLDAEDFWRAARATVVLQAPGAGATAPLEADGIARLVFRPTAAGPVTARLRIGGAALASALGPVDLVPGLREAGVDPALIRRVIADPSGWTLELPIRVAGAAPGTPILSVVNRT
ncbi:MAG: hypothetical protein AB7V42_00625 [Thermoleophilia bacterium]